VASLVTALCAIAACCADPAIAHDYTLGTLHIDHPYARPTPPGARTGGAYFTIRNDGREPDRLVGVASPVAREVEIHSMGMSGNLMKMRPAKAVEIAPASMVTFGPGTYHVMFLELHRPLSPGADVPLTLTFEKAGTVEVSVHVEAAVAAPGSAAPHRHR
jgi:copper(I)-binding protein